jgi:glycine/D-amino acid oxidase-like deaminating enzyme
MGYTEDALPHVGLVPGETDHFILAGFNGSGMASIFLVARGIAQMVRDEAPFEKTGLPSVFKTVLGRIKPVASDSKGDLSKRFR